MAVHTTYPNAPFNMATPVNKLLLSNKAENKTKSGSSVTNTEWASFVPLVIMRASMCSRFQKRLAKLITVKKKGRYSHVLSYIWTRISFDTLFKS